jgi:predicted DsbA family dithiol-disulfide isomerase
VPNSGRALRLSELARDAGVLDRLHPRLMLGYWSRRRDIGDPEVLVEEAASVGIDEPSARAALDSPELGERVALSTRDALSIGITGVPAWAVDGRILVPGAQPHAVFERVMRRLGHACRAGGRATRRELTRRGW